MFAIINFINKLEVQRLHHHQITDFSFDPVKKKIFINNSIDLTQ